MKLSELLRAGKVYSIDDAGGGEDDEQQDDPEAERLAEIDRLAAEKAETIAAERAEALAAQRVAEERAKWEAGQTKPAATDPYDVAVEEAKAKGTDWDKEGIAKRALEIQRGMQDERIAKLEQQTNQRFLEARSREIAQGIVGDDPAAQEYAVKFIAGGADLSNPDVKELIVRGARDVAREKAASKVSITSEKSDTTDRPVATGVRQMADMLAIGGIKLTDAEIKEALAEAV